MGIRSKEWAEVESGVVLDSYAMVNVRRATMAHMPAGNDRTRASWSGTNSAVTEPVSMDMVLTDSDIASA